MPSRSVVPALLCLLAASGAAQTAAPPSEKPETKVDALFQAMDSTVSPGCALSVIRDHKIIYERGYGMADLDHNIAITPTTVFHVASMSKQFTAASILMLAQDGKLSLDDPVRKYIPELPDFGTPITIRELLHHTSGLRDQWDLLDLSGWRYSHDLITDADVLYVVSHQRDLNFPPNTRYLYSNTGFTLLAQIVARVSGKSMRSFTTERIFAPLGMKNTHFRDDFDEIVRNMAYGYEPFGDTFHLAVTNFNTVGATSLLTTVEDLALWDDNFYTARIGGPTLIQQMQERGRLNGGKQIDYAAGLVVSQYRGLNVVDHGGADAGYRADLIRFPDQHFSVACLCNLATANPSNLAQKVAEIYLEPRMQPEKPAQAALDFKPVALTPQQMQVRTGVYVNVKDSDDLVRFIVRDGKLQVGNADEDDTYPIEAVDESHFRVASTRDRITFSPGKPGTPPGLAVQHRDGTIENFVAAPAFAPNAAELTEYTGTYSSREIDPLYQVQFGHVHVAGDGPEHNFDGLVLIRLKNDPEPLHPIVHDFFTAGVGKIRFTRNNQGAINGFLLTTGRVIDLRFDRGRPPIPAR